MLCQDNITSNEVYWGDEYPSLESVATFIDLCHQVGLKVVLKVKTFLFFYKTKLTMYNFSASDCHCLRR